MTSLVPLSISFPMTHSLLFIGMYCLYFITRAGRLGVLKCRWFVFICCRPVVLSDWLAPLIIMTLFARGDHVWAKYSGQMSEERNVDDSSVLCLPDLALWTVCSNVLLDPY